MILYSNFLNLRVNSKISWRISLRKCMSHRDTVFFFFHQIPHFDLIWDLKKSIVYNIKTKDDSNDNFHNQNDIGICIIPVEDGYIKFQEIKSKNENEKKDIDHNTKYTITKSKRHKTSFLVWNSIKLKSNGWNKVLAFWNRSSSIVMLQECSWRLKLLWVSKSEVGIRCWQFKQEALTVGTHPLQLGQTNDDFIWSATTSWHLGHWQRK